MSPALLQPYCHKNYLIFFYYSFLFVLWESWILFGTYRHEYRGSTAIISKEWNGHAWFKRIDRLLLLIMQLILSLLISDIHQRSQTTLCHSRETWDELKPRSIHLPKWHCVDLCRVVVVVDATSVDIGVQQAMEKGSPWRRFDPTHQRQALPQKQSHFKHYYK